MARDNYGSYEALGSPLVPMEPPFKQQPDEGSNQRQNRENRDYVDKNHPMEMDPTSDASSADRRIPRGYTPQKNLYDPYCNYDGYEAGNTTIVALDEYKVLENTVFAVPVVYAEDCQTIDGQNGKERI
jgi:hypothetical protein